MYEVRNADGDVLRFLSSKRDAVAIAEEQGLEVWKIQYVGDSWTRWKEERIK